MPETIFLESFAVLMICRRGDALEKRRVVMEAWAAFCEPSAGRNVLPMARPKASQ